MDAFRPKLKDDLAGEFDALKREIFELQRLNNQHLQQNEAVLSKLRDFSKHPLFIRNHGSHNVLAVSEWIAAVESAQYYSQRLLTARSYENGDQMLVDAVAKANPDGLFLEFGVASGRTTTCIANSHAGTLYAFDVFEGLPDDWRTGYFKGHFAGVPPTLPENVSLIKGLFSKTLPEFSKKADKFISFIHVDCDLYSSTKDIFDTIGHLLVPGSIIVFDEYMNYPGWKYHEFLAFAEFTGQNNVRYRYEGFVPSHQQVWVVITDAPSQSFLR